jgi:hypothetical protein
LNKEYDEIITQTLNKLMENYECGNPLEALIIYAKEYEESLIEEIELQGMDKEEAFKKIQWENDLFDMECATDKEKSMVHNRVLKMIEDHSKYLGRRIEDV